jgi:hypothetical protein
MDKDRISRASSSGVTVENYEERVNHTVFKKDAQIVEEPVTAPADLKQQKSAARKRVLTFIGLQLTLFLASLDG